MESFEVEKMSGTTHMMVEQLRKIPLSIDVLKQVRNWGTYFSDYLGLLRAPSVEYQLRNETRFLLRPGTADRTIFNDIWLRKLYCRESALRPGDVVIDIGAHIGLFSLFAASCSARVFSFEPFPENFSLLKENIARSNFQDRILPSPLAVWTTLGQVNLYRSEQSTGSHSIMVPSSTCFEAKTTTLAQIMRDHQIHSCRVLKIDAEGSEYPILYTAPSDVLGRIDQICLEWHDFGDKSHPEYEHNRLKTFLEERGFQVSFRPGWDVLLATRKPGN